MIPLRNFDFGNEYFDLDSKEIATSSYDSELAGWYKLVNGVINGLVVVDLKLYLLWESKKYLITNDSSIVIKESKNDLYTKYFEFYDSGDLKFSFEYRIEEDYSKVSPFEYIDYENYDWGFFVSNIVNNSERRNALIEKLSKK